MKIKVIYSKTANAEAGERLMFSYRVDVSNIPFQVGGDLYSVDPQAGFTIFCCRHAIDGIVVMKNGVGILAYGTLFLEEDEYCMTSLEHAQAWVRANRPELPCPYEDTADSWLKTAETLPADSRSVFVMADGKKMKARYRKKTKSFYSEDDLKGAALEHVTEWTENPDADEHISILDVQVNERREGGPRHLQELE